MRRSKYIFESQVDLTKPKKTVYDVIFRKNYDGMERDIPFGDLPKGLQDTDIIEYHTEDSFWSENNSYDAYTEIVIKRPRLETDNEQRERLEESQKFMEDLRERRYETYLKLKEEFEEPPTPII